MLYPVSHHLFLVKVLKHSSLLPQVPCLLTFLDVCATLNCQGSHFHIPFVLQAAISVMPVREEDGGPPTNVKLHPPGR